MITRVYIDNFRCFENFTYRPSRCDILLGLNGSGKSSLLEAISMLVDFAYHGIELETLFPDDERSRWSDAREMRFGLDFETRGSTWTYRLELARRRDEQRVKREEVWLRDRDGRRLVFEYGDGEARVHLSTGKPPLRYPALDHISPLSLLFRMRVFRGKASLDLFSTALDSLRYHRLVPQHIGDTSRRPIQWIGEEGENFASWYLHLLQERPERVAPYFELLREVLPGFQTIRLVGRSRKELRLRFAPRGRRPYELTLDELSDGQRSLLVLHAILVDAMDEERILLLDEPGNGLALVEIQPWLSELIMTLGERGQLIVASHNPEVIDYLAAHRPLWLSRPGGGPTRIREALFDREAGLSASEQIVRGWIGEE